MTDTAADVTVPEYDRARLLAWMADNQATGEEGARYFLKEKADIWTKWVPAEVAEKVKAAL